MTEKDFDPKTMTRATFDDIERIMDKLWGSGARRQYQLIAPREDGEVLDLTQALMKPAESEEIETSTLRDGEAESQAAHNPQSSVQIRVSLP